MENEEKRSDEQAVSVAKPSTSAHIVTAASVQAEEVPTIPLGSLETISTLQPAISVHSIAATPVVDAPAPLVVQPAEYRRSLGEWLQVWQDGIRPAYLPLAIMPVLLGSALAWTQSISTQAPLGHFHLTHFIVMIVVVLLLQVGAQMINDYYDYLHGIDTSNAFGPGGLIQQGLIKPTLVLSIGMSLLGIGVFLGLIVAASGGILVYLFGLVGVLCAYFYSATSRSLSALGLSELIGFLVFGPLITLGAYMVEASIATAGGSYLDQVSIAFHKVFIYSVAVGLLAAAIIHLNNMRDIEGDTQAGKQTIAAWLGLPWSRAWFSALLAGAYLIIIVSGVPHGSPHLLLITLWTLPTLVVVVNSVLRTDSSASLHLSMHKLLKMEVAFVVLLVIALIISALYPVLPHLPTHILPI
jgi:1,4-dihydroxy-2-naphthoate octaprenyltransferase